MRLRQLHLQRYRKARDVTLPFGSIVVLIGPNASGKSNLFDSLRFLANAVLAGDFSVPVLERGGFMNLTWKGEAASRVVLNTTFEDDGVVFKWNVSLEQSKQEFSVHEVVQHYSTGSPPSNVLENDPNGDKWWWSETSKTRERLSLEPTSCALSAAAKNEGFPGRAIYDFVRTWVFADPNPGVLKFPSTPDRPAYLDFFGRNLAARLRVIKESDPAAFERVRRIVGDITGIKLTQLDVRELDDGRVALSLEEQGLKYRVNQPAISNGVLRVLAFAVALSGADRARLFAVEEPENYVHPTTLRSLVELLISASESSQILVTTHSPLVLDCFMEMPEAIYVVHGPSGQGTTIEHGGTRADILKALEESGFSLGDFWLSRGFSARHPA
jgi:predicted ATPase